MNPIKLKNRKCLKAFHSDKYLSNHEAVAQALMGCLAQGDPEGFKEILSSYLEVVNKAAFSRKTGISERTLFRMITPEGNPTLHNIAKVIEVLANAS